MSKLSNIDFAVLDLYGDNYLTWARDAKISLKSKGLGDTIIHGNKEDEQNKAQAMKLLRHHLHESLKNYLFVEDPAVLWSDLKKRYEHKKMVILPRARYEWTQLSFQDYKSVSEYDFALHKITSKLALCGEKVTEEDMLEKTFPTLHTQYREKGFTYYQLISCLVAEEQNQLLMHNHGMRPTGSAPLPEANTASFGKKKAKQNH